MFACLDYIHSDDCALAPRGPFLESSEPSLPPLSTATVAITYIRRNMWLLGTQTLKLHNFITDVPDYVILSHTWGAQEVSFDDIKDPLVRRRLEGFDKIIGCCQQARQDGFDWAWIDTCCIDKRSSAELSEAINSMYNWYWQAAKCYAYLSDVPDLRDFKDSTWFERGWTLQELLAPAVVEFFDCEWGFIGTKLSLADDIVQATGIERNCIIQRSAVRQASVATKFSWASRRSTTRSEDIAYCLLGLMGVNMPMLYGEGDKAFFRLQLELLKNSNEHTIFAWGAFNDDHVSSLVHDPSRIRSILAPSPAHFRHSAGVTATHSSSLPHEVTNNGLRIKLRITRETTGSRGDETTVAWLRCRDKEGKTIGVKVLQNSSNHQYSRAEARMLLQKFWDPDFDVSHLTDVYLQVTDRDGANEHSRHTRPSALRVSQIHTYRGCIVKLVSVSDDKEVTTSRDLIDTSTTSTVDANYIVNELVVPINRVVCMSLLPANLPRKEVLILLGLCGVQPMIVTEERPANMSETKNWYLSLAEPSNNRQHYIRDSLNVGPEDFEHVVSAKVVKEGTRLIWSVSIVAVHDSGRKCFYGYFGSLKGKHQENNLACFCIDCRVRRLRSSTEKASRWQAKVEVRQEMLASAQRQQRKQQIDTGMGHVLECTCSACARESCIEVSTHVGASQPHVFARVSVSDSPLQMRYPHSHDGSADRGEGAASAAPSPSLNSHSSSSPYEESATQELGPQR